MAIDQASAAQAPIPEWLETILREYRASVANVFLLYGNVSDYVDHPSRNIVLRDYLSITLSKSFHGVTFSPDEGITFGPNPTLATDARKRFDAVMSGQSAAPANEAAALFAAANPNTASSGGDDLPRLPVEAIPLITDFVKQADRTDGTNKMGMAIIDRLDLICPPADKAMIGPGDRMLLALLARLGRAPELDTRGGLVILIAPSLEEVHADLRLASTGIRSIEVTPPNFEQRLMFIERIMERKSLTSEMALGELAASTAGLGRRHIEDLALQSQREGGNITRDLLRERKAQMIASEYAGILEILEPDIEWDAIGGHTLAKAWLDKRLVKTLQNERLNRYVPKGVMLAGPAGTGKTVLCRATAKRSGLNCVLLRAENIKGGIVGESEKKTALAIRGIEALAPCIVFVDEIDQRFRRSESNGGDGGSAVEANIFGRLLEFFGNPSNRGRIVLVAATNRPDLVDAAFKRKGRIDAIIPILPPDSTEERIDVINRLLVLNGRGDLVFTDGATMESIETVASLTDGFTQAELEGLVLEADFLAGVDDLTIGEALEQAKRTLRPRTADIREHTRLALAECDNADLVPERYRASIGNQGVAVAPARPAADPFDASSSERSARDLEV